jgi:hypothetical protein
MEFLSKLETEEATGLIIVARLGKDVWEASKSNLCMMYKAFHLSSFQGPKEACHESTCIVCAWRYCSSFCVPRPERSPDSSGEQDRLKRKKESSHNNNEHRDTTGPSREVSTMSSTMVVLQERN